MDAPRDPDLLLGTLRGHAARGAWRALRESIPAAGPMSADPEVLLLAAEAELRLGEPAAAADGLRGAIDGFRQRGDSAALRRAMNLLGAALFELGDLDEAQGAFARALELAGLDGDHLLVARATNNLGAIANLRGDHDRALGHFQLAIPAYQQLGHTVGLAESCHNIAIAYRDSRRLEDADEYERRAVEYAGESGSERIGAMALAGRADLSLRRGDPRLAERAALMVAGEFRRLDDPIGEADALRLAGEARVALGDANAALDVLDEAVRIAAARGAALVLAEALRARGAAKAAAGDREGGSRDAAAALEGFLQLGAADEVERTEALMARMAL